MDKANAFYIGYITKTRGLKGELQIYLEYTDYEELELDEIFIEINGRLVPYFATKYNVQANRTAYIMLEDVDHIDKTQNLIKQQVYLPESKRPQREEGELYYEDLVDYAVNDSRQGPVGQIVAVTEMPQQHIAEVAYMGKTYLFPLSDDLVNEIDEDAKTVSVTLPDGLIQLYIEDAAH